MLAQDDLDAAVAQGILTEAQATALRGLAADREKTRAAALGHEERFRFMRGFNDFFFASGVVLFGAGTKFFAGPTLIGNFVAAAMMWALAELLVARMRLVLPGILLVLFFAFFVFVAVPADWLGVSVIAKWPLLGNGFGRSNWLMNVPPATAAVKALIAAAAALVFYARFRLPFALLPAAGALVLAVMSVAWLALPDYAETAEAAALLLCGLAVFAAAMSFDISDRERVTRRADCAFWLHLLAAPLIVHSLIWLTTSNAFRMMNNQVAATIVAIVIVLTVIAVVIDRRALLVSTLTYLGVVIAYALRAASIDQTAIFFATLLVLGAMVLALGVGWLPLRRLLVGLVGSRLAARLPPVVSAA